VDQWLSEDARSIAGIGLEQQCYDRRYRRAFDGVWLGIPKLHRQPDDLDEPPHQAATAWRFAGSSAGGVH
jgi:hypothetical protein